jgi:xanthine/CO dehydrogenase XdhC/CoxF family maturation factor
MKEIKSIIKAYDEIDKLSQHAALATVVRVEGSSYRRTGARMLVMDNGTWIGGISGGCLEGDALKRARLAINSSRHTLITYDTSEDDPHQIGVGLGCNGIIDVLFCPLDFNDSQNQVEILKSCIQDSRETNTLITITGLSGEWRLPKTGQIFKYKDRRSLNIFGNIILENEIEKQIQYQMAEKKSAPKSFKTEDSRKTDLFIEILPPEIHVVLIGHQYDVYPMSRLFKELGWRVSIIAELIKVNSLITAIADEVRSPAEFSELIIDEHTAIILMSHDYKTDKKNLPKVLNTTASYIGMLGPRVRSERIWTELEQEGRVISGEEMERIYAPLGLDIGAVNPEEIALSLAAGIRAVFSGRDGSFLRDRKLPIHPRN